MERNKEKTEKGCTLCRIVQFILVVLSLTILNYHQCFAQGS
jgi:hypothetical protein